jgi:hypothetical protein
MRQRAQDAGTLRTTPQEVVRYDGGNIELAPVDPQVVYVPTYNPWAVYGAPVTPYPGFSLLGAIGDFLGSGALRYGLGIAMSAFTHTPWGWLAWGLDWLAHSLMFHQTDWYSHSTTVAHWGFPHHGFYAYAGHAGFSRMPHEYARASRNGSWGSESWRRSGYNSGGWHSFDRGTERRLETGRENFGADRSAHGFQSFRGDGRSIAGVNGFNRSLERAPEERGGYRSAYDNRTTFNHGAEGLNRSESYRASAGNFSRGQLGGGQFRGNEFRGNEFRDRSAESFSRSSSFSSSKSHSGGMHLFGGHSEKSFNGHSGGFGGGHAPKGFRGGNFKAKNFGSKSFGGHAHGGGGHSGGHGGGKHHG